jgi:hypothetical protein
MTPLTQLMKKVLTFYRIRRFITVFIKPLTRPQLKTKQSDFPPPLSILDLYQFNRAKTHSRGTSCATTEELPRILSNLKVQYSSLFLVPVTTQQLSELSNTLLCMQVHCLVHKTLFHRSLSQA